MVLAILKIGLIVSIISIVISKISTIISIVSTINIIIHGSAPLNKQELLGMPAMY